MSLIATSKATEVVGVRPLDKFVLLMLADRHNKDTERCDPSIPRLATDCCMSENGIRQSLARLREKGLIGVEHRTTTQGKDTSNFYTLLFLVAPPAGGVTLPGVQGEPPQQGGEPVIEPGNVTEEDNAPSARNLINSGEKRGAWEDFHARLSAQHSEGISSPFDDPEAYTQKCVKHGSWPPSVDVPLLMIVANAVKIGMGLRTVRLPQIKDDHMQYTATWFGKLASAKGEDFLPWLEWASAQVERKGSLADDKLLLHALTQSGTLKPFREWEAKRAVQA